jgi:phosphoribosylglycinamide formyltransferase-1
MKNLVFLCSGGGGNLRFVEAAIRFGWLPDARLAGVLTDRDCAAKTFAQENGIFERTMDFSQTGQQEVLEVLQRLSADSVVTNVHKILSPTLVSALPETLINLHYSMLPAFGGVIGATPVKRALEYGATLLGVTAHQVSAEVDAGRPLLQAAIPVHEGDDADGVMDVVFRVGCLVLLGALRRQLGEETQMRSRLLRLSERDVLFNPFGQVCVEWEEEAFWETLKLPAEKGNARARS